MAKKTTGKVSQFGTKGYGFIAGDDGEQYFVHQKNVFDKKRLKVGTNVAFTAQNSDKGWIANKVELADKSAEKTPSKPLSNGAIKFMFGALFLLQLAVAYKVFFLK